MHRDSSCIVEERCRHSRRGVVGGRILSVPKGTPEARGLNVYVQIVVRPVRGPRQLDPRAARRHQLARGVLANDVNVRWIRRSRSGCVHGIYVRTAANVHDVLGSRGKKDRIHGARIDHARDNVRHIRKLTWNEARLASARLEGDRPDIGELDDRRLPVLRHAIGERGDACAGTGRRQVQRGSDGSQRILLRGPCRDPNEASARLRTSSSGRIQRTLDDDDGARRHRVRVRRAWRYGDGSRAPREGRPAQKNATPVAEPHTDYNGSRAAELRQGGTSPAPTLERSRARIAESLVPVHVLILAAFFPELDPLRTALGDSLVGSIAGLSVTARVSGIGLAAAAAGAAVHAAELRPDAVVLIGSCGAYARAGLAIGDVVVGRRSHLVDLNSLAGHGEFPEPIAVVFDANAALTQGLSADGTRTCSVATTLAITVDDSVASRIANQVDVQVEHLEAHGVATACSSLGVPFAMTLGVANFVGSRGRDEWRAHRCIAEAAAAKRVLRWLETGAPGAISLARSRL